MQPPPTERHKTKRASAPPTKPYPQAKPPDSPEHSSLDNVLSSAGGGHIFEPPRDEGDTPAEPIEEFMWADDVQRAPDLSFNDVLSALPTDVDEDESSSESNPFTDLVNSMRSEEAHRPLPSRQQQFVEYILTGESDPLLDEPPEAPPADAPWTRALGAPG